MEENKSTIDFEEVLDTEISDIWELLFPYMAEKKTKLQNNNSKEESKPRRYLRFLTM